MSDQLRLLGVDLDRTEQTLIANAFNAAGVFYRYVADKRRITGGAQQLRPHAFFVSGAVGSTALNDTLDAISHDVDLARIPIICMVSDDRDAPFVAGLKSGVIGFLAKPFSPNRHLAEIKKLLAELPARTGTVMGHGNTEVLHRLFDHLVASRRSGVLSINPRTPSEGRVHFTWGRVDSARLDNLTGDAAIAAMKGLPQAQWTFTEVSSGSGPAPGVIIQLTTEAQEEASGAPAVADPYEMPAITAPDGPSAASAAAPAVASGALRLLVVDDEEALVRMFSTLFRKRGFEVTTAADGAAGFEAAQHATFDAVVADLNMPRLDGWGMLRALRDDYRTRELPVAFLSAHDDYREKLKALDAGAQAYFPKGTRLDALVNHVNKLLEPRSQVATAIASRTDIPIAVGEVGPQWLIKALAADGTPCRLDAKDAFAQYTLDLANGSVKHATAQAGRFTAEGEKAFNAFVASRNAEGHVHFGNFPGAHSLGQSAQALIDNACQTLNDNERRMRDNLLVSANEIEVHADFYNVYQQVGPKQWLEAAKLICEDRLPPRDVLAKLDSSPIELEEMMKDLIRRGVVSLKRT